MDSDEKATMIVRDVAGDVADLAIAVTTLAAQPDKQTSTS